MVISCFCLTVIGSVKHDCKWAKKSSCTLDFNHDIVSLSGCIGSPFVWFARKQILSEGELYYLKKPTFPAKKIPYLTTFARGSIVMRRGEPWRPSTMQLFQRSRIVLQI